MATKTTSTSSASSNYSSSSGGSYGSSGVNWSKVGNATGAGIGAVVGALGSYYAAKAQASSTSSNGTYNKKQAYAQAAAVRRNAQVDYDWALSAEKVSKANEMSDRSDARLRAGANGFTYEGTANNKELTIAQQYAYDIEQSRAQRENAYASAEYDAKILEWQGDNAKAIADADAANQRASAKSGLFGSIISSAVSIGAAFL